MSKFQENEAKQKFKEILQNGTVDQLKDALKSQSDLLDGYIYDEYSYRYETPIFIAAKADRSDMIEALIELGSKLLDTHIEKGWTPMTVAADRGHTDVVETLFRLGSRALDTPTNFGSLPMRFAAERGAVDTIETMVRLGSKAVTLVDMHGNTSIHYAGNANVIETLIRLGSKDIDRPDHNRQTPIDAAAKGDSFARVKSLLALGAVPRVPQGVSEEMEKLLMMGVTEDEAVEVRHRVYFSRSLTDRLLFDLDMNKNAGLLATRRLVPDPDENNYEKMLALVERIRTLFGHESSH